MYGSDPKDYEIKAELATCCHGIGTVYLAKHKGSREFVALKRFKMDKAKEEANLIRVSICEPQNRSRGGDRLTL